MCRAESAEKLVSWRLTQEAVFKLHDEAGEPGDPVAVLGNFICMWPNSSRGSGAQGQAVAQGRRAGPGCGVRSEHQGREAISVRSQTAPPALVGSER